MQRLELKPTHKPVQNYYAVLRQFEDLGVTHESAVHSAFQGLLDHCARQHDWPLVPEWKIRRPRQHPLHVDGARHSLSASNGERARVKCRSEVRPSCLPHGFWEAKDSRDDLPKEVRKKFDLGFPHDNIGFQTPRCAVLFQNDALASPEHLYAEPAWSWACHDDRGPI
ncbi:MAG: hypothetical protein NT154_14045 [Verrucomicrobia bacterium]|nr:hypothetical protein [Verrucomicrobiota bacterium]